MVAQAKAIAVKASLNGSSFPGYALAIRPQCPTGQKRTRTNSVDSYTKALYKLPRSPVTIATVIKQRSTQFSQYLSTRKLTGYQGPWRVSK